MKDRRDAMANCKKCGGDTPRIQDTLCRGCVREILEPLFAHAAASVRGEEEACRRVRIARTVLQRMRQIGLLILLALVAMPSEAQEARRSRIRPPCEVSAKLSMWYGGPLEITGSWANALGTRGYVYQVPWSAQQVQGIINSKRTYFQTFDVSHPGTGPTEILLLVYGPDPGTPPTCSTHTWIIQ
jgi:hypothetical protein